MQRYWQDNPCGDRYLTGASLAEGLKEQARTRYELEPYIREFARFEQAAGKHVCEVGVGVGADHEQWANAQPSLLVGVDLTPRGIELTRSRIPNHCALLVGDAEHLPFGDATFDLVYSWGVIHHSPDTALAVSDIHRILRPGGMARAMIYNRRSIVGGLLWARYGLLGGEPRRSLTDIYAHHLESPGTKAYTWKEAEQMFADFSSVEIRTQLSFGDLLQGRAGERHVGRIAPWVRGLWPRWLISRTLSRFGLYLLIEARK